MQEKNCGNCGRIPSEKWLENVVVCLKCFYKQVKKETGACIFFKPRGAA